MKRIKIFFAWYDLWFGVYIDRKKKNIYICLLPMIVIKISYKKDIRASMCSLCGVIKPYREFNINKILGCKVIDRRCKKCYKKFLKGVKIWIQEQVNY